MTAAPTPVVTIYLPLAASGGAYFTLDDTLRGKLDDATYLLAPDTIGSDVSSFVRSVSIRRGRVRELDEFTAGVATVVLNNTLRTFDPSYAAGPYYPNIAPGKRVTITAGGFTVFDGLIDDWNFDFPLQKNSTASFSAADALAQLGAKEFDAWTATAGQTAGARLSTIMDRAEVSFPSGSRSFEAGSITLQGDNISWGTNVLNYCQSVAKADYGKLFASAGGVLTFLGSAHAYASTGAPQFRDDHTGSAIPYYDVEIDYGTELLFNRVSVDPKGMTKQTSTDAASIDAYGVRSYSLSNLPLQTEAQASDLAASLLATYKDPTTRFSSVSFHLHALEPTNQGLLLNLDIGSVVRVVYSPNGIAPAIDKFCAVEGITHTLAPQVHDVTFSLQTLADGYDTSLNLILDDTSFGLLDSNLVAF